MRALATRPGRLALGIAALTAAALGTVGASAAQASGTSPAKAPAALATGVSVHIEAGRTKAGHEAGLTKAGHGKPPKGAGFGVACRPTAGAPEDGNSANDDFAACMRDQGRSVFPNFHASKDGEGHVRLQVKIRGGFDPTSRSCKKAMKACGPIMKKAGVTFPAGPGLPPLPGRPGRPGEPGGERPSLHTEKGGSDDGLPGLTTSARSA
ncbi:hypothetical protein [Streptomyces sp. NPDC048419]|uniref:hypothetical protein n=1 Tax=Streptomyces sp. NPDC048419 TaxID=3365547 RepID=UPI00371745C3